MTRRDLSQAVLAIAKLLKPGEAGLYIEAGANDGLAQSNTKSLEALGWTGLLIEPSPVAYSALKKNRPKNVLENVALAGTPATTEIQGTFSHGSLMGSAHPEMMPRDKRPAKRFTAEWLRQKLGIGSRVKPIAVPAVTLDSLLEKHGISGVDLFILDVEGYELEVLQGLRRHDPRVLIVETRSWNFMPIADLLCSRGYSMVANLSGFTSEKNPKWSGDHQDYCWVKSDDFSAMEIILRSA